MRPGVAIIVLWVGFVVSWLAAAWWSNKTEKGAGVRSQVGYRVVMLVGALLFLVPGHDDFGSLRLWVVTPVEAWICVALVALGMAFCWWARDGCGPPGSHGKPITA
jgi:hypothetical protein